MTARLAGIVVCVAALAAAAPARAGRAILVLPVDGSADSTTRSTLTSELVKLARSGPNSNDSQVTKGHTTYAEAALAVGCDAKTPRCSDELLTTLAIDELIWGTADRDGGQIKLIVRRASKGAPPRELTIALAATDADRDAQLAPLFRPAEPPHAAVEPAPTPAAAVSEPGPPPTTPAETPANPVDAPEHRDRTPGIALASGGALILAIGVAFWIDYSSLQGSINNHATHDLSDFDDLRSLEDRAQTAAITGDVLVPIGLVVGAAGAYLLYRSRTPRVALSPAPIHHGLGLTLTITGTGL